MQLDSTLLKKAKGGDSKAFDKLISNYWRLVPIPSVHSKYAHLAVDWYQEAKMVFFQFIQGWDEAAEDFQYKVFSALRTEYGKFRYQHTRKNNSEVSTCPDAINDQLQSAHTWDDTEYLLDLDWIRNKLKKLMRELLTDSEYEVVAHDFFSGEDPKVFYTARKTSFQVYYETKERALEKLRENPKMRQLWEQAQDIFVNERKS